MILLWEVAPVDLESSRTSTAKCHNYQSNLPPIEGQHFVAKCQVGKGFRENLDCFKVSLSCWGKKFNRQSKQREKFQKNGFWMTNDHVVARFSDPRNRVTITEGCYSAKANNKRWLSENETHCSTRSVLRGNIFLNITTLISPFVYNPNKQRGGYYSSPNIITNCVRTLSANIKQIEEKYK